MEDEVEMKGVREYSENRPVMLTYFNGRLCAEAINENGHASTLVDLQDLINWVHTSLKDAVK